MRKILKITLIIAKQMRIIHSAKNFAHMRRKAAKNLRQNQFYTTEITSDYEFTKNFLDFL